jgi:hypothetical protein
VGQTAIGGGAVIVAGTATPAQLANVALGRSEPTGGLTAWTATAWETDGIGQTWGVTVTALCADVT